MTSSEIAKVLTDNPGLPVYAMVDSEVVSDDNYASYLAHCVSARVSRITCHEAGAPDGLRVWDYQDIDDLVEDWLADEPTKFLPGEWEGYEGDGIDYWTFNGKRVDDDDIERIAREYAETLPWEDCILLVVEP
jgi:hypothetical protein